MYQIDDEIKEIMESHGIRLKSRLDALQLKTVVIDCPTCHAKTRLAFDPVQVASKISGKGISNVIVSLPCKHVIVAHVDKEVKIRGLLEIEQGINVSSEPLDVRLLREQVHALENLHAQLVKEGTTDMQFKVFGELARIRKVINGIE